jgi:glutamine amidotransferase
MIVIVDYGMGNLASILNLLRRIGVQAQISSCPQDIAKADKIILPGVGSFDAGMKNLRQSGLIPILESKVLDRKTPILGICLGLQLLGQSSEEGRLPGLGWINADTVRFDFDRVSTGLKIPHMGWNTVCPIQSSKLFRNVNELQRFYFVHSYHVICQNPDDISAMVNHGKSITAAIERDNVMGVQFHPEKSHVFGMNLLRAFADVTNPPLST